MQNTDFDILHRTVQYSAKIQSEKIHENVQKINCYLYNNSWVLELSHKLHLAQKLQLCLSTPYPILPEL